MDEILLYTAFEDQTILATGPLEKVAIKVKKHLKSHPNASILVFSNATGKQMDLDLRGSESEVLERLQMFISSGPSIPVATGPGRPKLGVVSREVSLLPRHWEWLATQSGGASATLRRLVEEAKRGSVGKEQIKSAQERTYKFMSAIAGNLPNYEEALRSLFAKDKKKFVGLIKDWPTDIRQHAQEQAGPVWD